MSRTTPPADAAAAHLAQLRRMRPAKDAMDPDWPEPLDRTRSPQDRPYGTEAIFRDDSGNWCSFSQRRADGLDLGKEWGC